jgi:hypothetical protein
MLVVGTKRKGQMDAYLNLVNTGTALPRPRGRRLAIWPSWTRISTSTGRDG